MGECASRRYGSEYGEWIVMKISLEVLFARERERESREALERARDTLV